MGGYYIEGIPTGIELENKSHLNKYTVNNNLKKGITFSRLTLLLMALGVLLLIGLVVALTILLHPAKCAHSSEAPAALTLKTSSQSTRVLTRLPMDLMPFHYRLQIIPSLETFTTHGTVTINVNVTEETNKVVLNMYDIEVEQNFVKVRNLNNSLFVDIIEQKYNNDSETYTIELQNKLEKGYHYSIEIAFISKMNDHMQGFYRSRYVEHKNNTEKWMASTQFSPTDARRAFPCFDEPTFKATFSIIIARPTTMTTISNMPLKMSQPIGDKPNWIWDHYLETPRTSTYLVAFALCDLAAYRFTNESAGRLYTVRTRMDPDQTRMALDLTPKIINYLEEYFEIKLPLPKIDLVAVPDFGFNAMENWGMITFRETVLLYDEKSSTVEDKRQLAIVLAHELAHQWFGNLVTPKWWNDLWLKEGFANYLYYLSIDHVNPSWNIMDEFLQKEVYAAFYLDWTKTARPLTFDVTTIDDIRQMFDSISYSKGASLIRMLNSILGEELFKDGLIKYLTQYIYGNADHDDLWQAFSEKLQKQEADVKTIMDSWIKQPGFPVITATRNPETKDVTVSQRRFLLTNSSSDETLWWVPISYATDLNPTFSDTQPKVWLKNVQHTNFSLDAQQWWLLNVKQTGYYIVNYDNNNWQALVYNIMVFPPVIRAQLISDSMNLARSNLLNYDIPLRMLTNIGVQDRVVQYIPYQAALHQVTFLHDMLVSTPIYKKFMDFIFRIFRNSFENIGFNELTTDDYVIQQIRKLVLKWACKRSGTRCANQARILFRAWLDDPEGSKIRANLQEVVYCTGIREGGEAEWNLAYKHLKRTHSINEKIRLINALGCSQTPWILARYLDLILQNNTDIRKQDSYQIFNAVAKNPVGYTLAFGYIRTYWAKINQHYGSAFSLVRRMVDALPTFMNTPFLLAELETFKKNNLNELGTSEQAFNNAIATVQANVQWIENSYKTIEQWLDDHEFFGF